MDRITLRQLRALAGTVRLGTVTAAARQLDVTPPAVSAQLKLLEQIVGAPLFDRSLDGFVPTAVGQELLDAAIDVENRLARAGERITALRTGSEGSVILGAVSTAKYVVPSIVAAFQKIHPRIRVKLVVGNRGEVLRAVQRDEYDLVIMGRPPVDVPLVSEELCDHPHVLVAPPDHPLAAARAIPVDALVGERFLARETGSGTRLLMDRFLERGGGWDIVEMGTNETIKQAVLAGLGVGLLSAHTCHAELVEGKLVALDVVGLPLVRKWYVLHRSDRHLSAAAAVLRRFVLDEGRERFPRL